MNDAVSKIISHKTEDTEFDISKYQRKLLAVEDRVLPLDEEQKLLRQLSEFELGRFLLQNRGVNGFWTSYIIIHAPNEEYLHPLEEWIVFSAPVIKASRERYYIMRHQLQQLITSHMTIASLPCGLFEDIITIDYSKVSDIKLVGIDLDNKSLEYAAKNAKHLDNVELINKNAWHLNEEEKYDILTSSGLNIYEPDNLKVAALYRQFYNAIKPGGYLILSFLTPPPSRSDNSPWHNYIAEDVLKQKAIFSDIIDVGWQSFRSADDTKSQLEAAGFYEFKIIYDSQYMFPVIVARK